MFSEPGAQWSPPSSNVAHVLSTSTSQNRGEHSTSTTTCFSTVVNAAGCGLIGTQLLVDGEWWLCAETTTDVVGCSGCGTRAVGHGRTRCLVRDLVFAGVPCVLVFKRRRWKCPELGCGVNTWSEHHEQILLRASLTRRARQRLADMVNSDGDTIVAAAVDFGVGWHTANAAVPERDRPAPGRVHFSNC